MDITCRNVSRRTVKEHDAIWYIQLLNRYNSWHFSQLCARLWHLKRRNPYETLLHVNDLASWKIAHRIPRNFAVLVLVVTIITFVSNARTLCASSLTHSNVHDCQDLEMLDNFYIIFIVFRTEFAVSYIFAPFWKQWTFCFLKQFMHLTQM